MPRGKHEFSIMTLSQFLLAAAESRLTWFFFRPRLPAKDAPFTFGCYLALVAASTAIALVIGALLTLLVAGTTTEAGVMWIIGFFGAFGLCHGLVWHALVALAWGASQALHGALR